MRAQPVRSARIGWLFSPTDASIPFRRLARMVMGVPVSFASLRLHASPRAFPNNVGLIRVPWLVLGDYLTTRIGTDAERALAKSQPPIARFSRPQHTRQRPAHPSARAKGTASTGSWRPSGHG